MSNFFSTIKDKFFSSIKKIMPQTILLFLLFIFTPFINFFLIENVNGNFDSLRRLIGFLNILIIGFFMVTVYILTNRMKISIIVITLLSFIFSAGCYFTYAFRGVPLYFTDLSTIGTAMVVADEYDYTFTPQLILQLVVSLLLIVFAILLKEKQRLKLKFRIPCFVLYFICLCLFLYIFVFSNSLAKWKVGIRQYMPQKSYEANGHIVTFIRSAQLSKIEKPEGYSLETVNALADEINAGLSASTSSNGEYKTPNVIVIMNEAFSDMQSLGPIPTSQEVLPFINSLSENTVKGKTYVSVYGGKTANSEFEFLTGESMFFLPSVIPYQLLIKEPTSGITSALVNQGYVDTMAMHPHLPNGYNRSQVYPLLGFEKFISKLDFPDDESVYVRNRISDDADVKRIISEYEAHKLAYDSPFYMFNVTMQNHTPYDTDYENLPITIKITDPDYYDADVERYLNLAHLSDASLKTLVDYFSQAEEDTVIVFFGDHQPKFDNSFYEKVFGKSINKLTPEENMELYQVPFVIWANYDIEESENEIISLNYLAARMLDACHLETPPYFRFLSELQKEVPAITVNGFWGKDGTFYSSQEDSPYDEILQKYRLLQYNNLIDTNNRAEHFFD
ncbi:MAG: sulfatase-like hydrolase/transferase [Lachnospiraceae bacterium]|nr:sulfatase-like hydrolase/transferase [Lachnospiraceae bacterium]